MRDVKSEAKKILFVVTRAEMGGAQRYVAETVVWLAEQGYEVLVAAGGKDGSLISNLKSQISNLHLKTKNLKYLRRTPNPFEAVLAIREIYKLLKKERPDILFLCSTMAGLLGSVAGLLYKKFSKLSTVNCQLSIVYRIGGWAFNDPGPWWQKEIIVLLERFTSRFKDKIIVNSEFDLQTALKHKICPPAKIVKIYNGLGPEEINFLPQKEARQKLLQLNNLTPKDPLLSNERRGPTGQAIKQFNNFKIVGTIANFYKTKGLEYLLKAIHHLKTKGYKPCRSSYFVTFWKVVIIGEGKRRKKLETLIAKYHLQDKVFLLGRLPEARKYLKAFDVFVLPSLKEGFPWVILEAMAAEVPIVATKVGAMPEILDDGKSGFLVEPGNPEILAKKIQELLSNPELQKKFVVAAKEKLSQFSQEKMLKETKMIIES